MSPIIRKNRRALRVGTVLAAACLALTACGGDDSEPSTDGEAPSAAPKGDPIKIGYIASKTGSQGQNGVDGEGVLTAWTEMTNAAGGIDGHPVEFTVVDTKTAVPGATAAAKQFLADEDVDMILLSDQVSEGSMADLFKDTPVAVLSGGGSSEFVWSTVPGMFQMVSGASYVASAYIDQAKIGGATNVGWAACAEVAICAELGASSMDYAESIGLKAGGVQSISSTAVNYTAECLAFKNKGVDSISLNIGYTVGVRYAADCIQQGFEGQFSVINAGFDQKAFSEVQGFKSTGGTQGFPWWADAAPVKKYRDALAKYSPDTTVTSGNSTSIWSALELFAKAVNDAKPAELNRTTVMDAMYQVKDETLDGLLAEPVSYTKGQPGKKIGCSWIFTYNAGDENPTSIPPKESGNGAEGDLASTCLGYPLDK